MNRRALLLGLGLPCALLGSAALLSAQTPQVSSVDPNQLSPLAGKTFDFSAIGGGKASDWTKSAPGFDKAYQVGTSELNSRKAEFGGRDIYAPTVDFGKVYPTSDSPLFKGISPLSGQTSSLMGKTSAFSVNTRAPGLDRILDDRFYQGREADIIRQAMDRLDRQSRDALSQQISSSGDAAKNDSSAAPSDHGNGPRTVKPLISIDDVKLLIDKDVAPVSLKPSSAPSALPAAPVSAPAPTPQIKAIP